MLLPRGMDLVLSAKWLDSPASKSLGQSNDFMLSSRTEFIANAILSNNLRKCNVHISSMHLITYKGEPETNQSVLSWNTWQVATFIFNLLFCSIDRQSRSSSDFDGSNSPTICRFSIQSQTVIMTYLADCLWYFTLTSNRLETNSTVEYESKHPGFTTVK